MPQFAMFSIKLRNMRRVFECVCGAIMQEHYKLQDSGDLVHIWDFWDRQKIQNIIEINCKVNKVQMCALITVKATTTIA